MNDELNRIIFNLAQLRGKPLREYRALALSTLSAYEVAAINQAVRLKQRNSERQSNIKTLSWD